jgi:diaminobutyrate-2-oxoglutarate transaminase
MDTLTSADPVNRDRLDSEVCWYSRRMPGIFGRAKGAMVWDAAGNRYIDFLTGCGVLNYGHNPERLKRALLDYMLNDGIVHSMDLHTAARQEFMRALDAIILQPRGLTYRIMFPGPTGANAVEAALKLARKVTGRPNIAAFTNGFHGVTLGALAATGAASKRAGAGIPLGLVDRLPFDGYFGSSVDTIDLIARLLDDEGSGFDPPAAFLVETVQGEGGVRAASSEWLQRIAALAQKHGSLLIIDDVQAGCGRTGTFFSFEPAGLQPDLVCLSKALSGYGLPLAALLIRPEIDIWEPGEHNGTFRGHNYAFVTARAALDYWQDRDFLHLVHNNAARLERLMSELLAVLSPDFLPRGRGLMRGIACPNGAFAETVCAGAFRRGVLVETSGPRGEVVKFLPPLDVAAEVMDHAFEQLTEAFLTVTR